MHCSADHYFACIFLFCVIKKCTWDSVISGWTNYQLSESPLCHIFENFHHIYIFKNSIYYLLEFYLVLVYLIQMKWRYFYIYLREIINIITQTRGDISYFLSILMNLALKSYRLYFRFCYNCSCIFRKGIINQQAFLWDCVVAQELRRSSLPYGAAGCSYYNHFRRGSFHHLWKRWKWN